MYDSVQFSRSVVPDSLRPHELQHARPPCPSPTPGVYSNSYASSRWCHPAISSSVVPFSSCPQSLPASESFPMSQLFTWGGQSIGVSASASVLPENTQGHHQTLLLSPVTSTTGYCFCFGSIPSFFLELFLHWFPVAYCTYWPGEFLFQYPIILPFHTVHGVLKARILKRFAIPFSSGPHSVRSLHLDLPVLGCPMGMA